MVTAQQKTSDILVFDRDLVRCKRQRALKGFGDYDFLFQWSKKELSERLLDINREFGAALQIGSRGALKTSEHQKIEHIFTCDLTPHSLTQDTGTYIQATEEFLPIANESMDLVLSNLNLHAVNDLPGTLIQIRKCLKADGLFISSMFGGETLHELRSVLTTVELGMTGGISPRIAPFADKQQMGDLLQRGGFNLPVVDSEIITVTYDNIFKLFHDIRGMGESNAILARDKRFVSRDFFMRAAQEYQEKFAQDDGRIVASFEIIFLLGWAPHESQQKPLRPGSAEHRLADALSTIEITTGDKAKP